MKNKTKKIIAFIVAMMLICGLIYIANSFVGNPVSKNIVKRNANEYIEKNYAECDYEIDGIAYSFKDAKYYVHVSKHGSEDEKFSLAYTMGGELVMDDHKNITDKWNTMQRINMDYFKLVKGILESDKFGYDTDIAYGEIIEKYDNQYEGVKRPGPDYGLDRSTLDIDGIYDVRKTGREYGHIVLSVQTEEPSYEKAAEIMLAAKDTLDRSGIPFRSVDFTLMYPRDEEGMPVKAEKNIEIVNMAYEDIHKEDMEERIEKAVGETKAYYREMDRKYK